MNKSGLAEVFDNVQARLEEYEELLVKRDQLFKEAGSYMTVYTAEFGDMITANFELKIECIKKKKMISYCRRRMNRGLSIDAAHMQEEIEQEMTLYYIQLQDMLHDTENAKKAESVGEYRFRRAKKIYHRLAKLIHPDIYGETLMIEKLKELWVRTVSAYQRSDVDELDDLEILVHKALEEMGDEGFEIDLSDIEERIERVESQINEILTTEPYTYGEMLNDEEKKAAFIEQLKAEHDDYEQYLESLTKSLEELLSAGGVTLVWKLN